MPSLKFARGYRRYFLGKDYIVNMPTLSETLKTQVARRSKRLNHIIRYHHYSVIQHAERRFPIISAANINGAKFKKLRRDEIFSNGRDHWRKDKRIGYNRQWGKELYTSPNSDFDIGHLTKREDVQWGQTYALAKKHAQNTFYFTNAVPQHSVLNQGIWRRLENYILHHQATSDKLKINVFSGCVFKEDDPLFVNEVRGEQIQLPTLFWKVVYYINHDNELCRTAFMIGQAELLQEANITVRSRGTISDTAFMDFEKGDTFQVNVSFIEELTGCSFELAKEIFHDHRDEKLILEEVQARGVDSEMTQVNIIV